MLGMFGEADGRHLKRSVVGPIQAASAAWRACASFGPRALLALSAGNTLHADSLEPLHPAASVSADTGPHRSGVKEGEFKSRQPDDFREGGEALRSTARRRTLASR